LKAGKRVMEEMMEDDVMGQSLLEKAGLVRPKREEERRHKAKADLAAEFLLEEDEDEQQPPKLRLD
jgi:hypothetical protein